MIYDKICTRGKSGGFGGCGGAMPFAVLMR